MIKLANQNQQKQQEKRVKNVKKWEKRGEEILKRKHRNDRKTSLSILIMEKSNVPPPNKNTSMFSQATIKDVAGILSHMGKDLSRKN